jgi:hypothetical protein
MGSEFDPFASGEITIGCRVAIRLAKDAAKSILVMAFISFAPLLFFSLRRHPDLRK